jgi:hypothetical protein
MIAPPFILEIYTTALIVAVASESIPMCTVLDVKKLQYKCMGIKTYFYVYILHPFTKKCNRYERKTMKKQWKTIKKSVDE